MAQKFIRIAKKNFGIRVRRKKARGRRLIISGQKVNPASHWGMSVYDNTNEQQKNQPYDFNLSQNMPCYI